MAEEVAIFDGDSDRPDYIQKGESPSFLIQEMLSCEPEVADAIVSYLSKKYSWDVVKDGEADWYDGTSEAYEINIPDDPSYDETWLDFCNSIKHWRRFFNRSAEEALDHIIGRAIRGDWPGKQSPVRTIGGPADSNRYIFRGRIANEELMRRNIYASPSQELGPPPKQKRPAGRMNAHGVSIFYGAMDSLTCVAEMRTPVGGTVVLGRFEIIRPIRVLDMTTFDQRAGVGSYFRSDLIEMHSYARFLRGFHRQISLPVLPGEEALDYLPTQFVAEYLSTVIDPPIDGIIYASAQTSSKNALNIAIFAHACDVEPDAPDVELGEFDLRLDRESLQVARVTKIKYEFDTEPLYFPSCSPVETDDFE